MSHDESGDSTASSQFPPERQPLSELAAAARRGDEFARRELYARIWLIAFSVADLRFAFPKHDSEDVAQTVCLAAVESRRQIASYSAWVFTTAKYVCLSWIRDREALSQLVDMLKPDRPDYAHPGEEEIAAGIWDLKLLLDRLPLSSKLVIRLRFAVGLTWAEIDHLLFAGREVSRKRVRVVIAWLAKRLDPAPRTSVQPLPSV